MSGKVQFQRPENSSMTKQQEAYYQANYGQLIGGVIKSIVILEEDSEFGVNPTPVFVVIVGNKRYEVHLLSDEEGNDAGHAEVIEVP